MLRSASTLVLCALGAASQACGGPPVGATVTEAQAECRASLANDRACALIGEHIEPKRRPLAGALTDIPPTGQAALVDFWSVDCAPCLAALPALQAAARTGVPVFGICVDDNPGRAEAVARTHGARYPILLDDTGSGRFRGAFRVGGDLPRLFVLDGTGAVRGVFGGAPGAVDEAVTLYRAVLR